MNVTARASRRIAASPARVWTTLTSKAGMKRYMMGADVETDWVPGHPIVMKGEVNGKAFEDVGEIRAFVAGHSFSYTHQSGGKGPVRLVTFELDPLGDGSAVTITQSNADGSASDADRAHRAEFEKTWAMMLEAVEKACVSA